MISSFLSPFLCVHYFLYLGMCHWTCLQKHKEKDWKEPIFFIKTHSELWKTDAYNVVLLKPMLSTKKVTEWKPMLIISVIIFPPYRGCRNILGGGVPRVPQLWREGRTAGAAALKWTSEYFISIQVTVQMYPYRGCRMFLRGAYRGCRMFLRGGVPRVPHLPCGTGGTRK